MSHETFVKLRQSYPVFYYRSYTLERKEDRLELSYHFEVPGLGEFRPGMTVPLPEDCDMARLQSAMLERLAFCIGMVELISYWKAACPPRVVVEAMPLNEEELAFWKKLYWGGLGEFFYRNKIETDAESFLQLESCRVREGLPYRFVLTEEGPMSSFASLARGGRVLVPVGGGKDSVVTLELLKTLGKRRVGFGINPTQAALDCMDLAGLDARCLIKRRLDPFLLELNARGFLNGHTPFSALLAFVSLLAAYLNGCRYIALSNEGSANEASVKDTEVNHQYSKSSAFEADFQAYVSRQLGLDIRYFSFLRPMSELAIARVFASLPESYHLVFRSCNAGSKQNCWCGHCGKCLFIAVMLAPFLGVKRVEELLGTPLFEAEDMLPLLEELVGLTESKPFECVGTRGEVQLALDLLLSRWSREYPEKPLPLLLDTYKKWRENGSIHNDMLSSGSDDVSLQRQYDKLFGCYYNSTEIDPGFLAYLPTSYPDGLEERYWPALKPVIPQWKAGCSQGSQRPLLAYLEQLFQGKQLRSCLILGLGREGQGILEQLASLENLGEAFVLGLADQREPSPAFRAWAEKLPYKINWHTGPDYLEALRLYPLCVKSPGISLRDYTPALTPEERNRAYDTALSQTGSKEAAAFPAGGRLPVWPGCELVGQTSWFLEAVGARTVGVTGTKGKSTTTSLVHAMLSASDLGDAYLLGNIGRAPLTAAATFDERAVAALELSCHQLQFTFASPHVAVVTNVFPEHLDHYRDFDEYKAAKENILRFQTSEDIAVLSADQPELLEEWSDWLRSGVYLVTLSPGLTLEELRLRNPKLNLSGLVRIDKPDAASLVLRAQGECEALDGLGWTDLPVSLRSPSQAMDFGFAALASLALGAGVEAIRAGGAGFRGLPHRCEEVAVRGGVRYVNDSISTIPETCLAALRSLPRVHTLLVGGMDRGISYESLLEVLVQGAVPLVLCLPDTGLALAEELKRRSAACEVRMMRDLDEAVKVAAELAPAGTTCLFSPAAASYHLYKNFEARGEAFRAAVLALPDDGPGR